MYYYGARYYDPKMSLFISVDPLSEQFQGWSPYHYVHNNPINLIDPTGMAAENADGGIKDWWKRIKSVFTGDSDRPNAPQYADDGSTMMEEMTIDRRPSFVQRMKRSFSGAKLKSDWKRIKENTGWNHLKGWADKFKYDMTGGTGGIRFLGFGSENTEGKGEIEGKMKSVKVSDMSTYSFGDSRLIQHWLEAAGKGISIGEDGNILDAINKDSYINHSYKKYGIYQIPYSNKNIIIGRQNDTMLRKSELQRFTKDRQFDSINLIPLLNK